VIYIKKLMKNLNQNICLKIANAPKL